MDKISTASLQLLSHRIAALETMSSDVASTEAFAVLRQLENIFFRLVTNFTINITKGFKDFKRGELKAYQDTHRGDIRQLYSAKLNWMNISKTIIPIPRSLHRPYLVASEHVSELLAESRYTEAVTSMTQSLTRVGQIDSPDTVEALKEANLTLTKLWGTQGYVPTTDRLLPYMTLEDRGQTELAVQDVFSNITDIQNTSDVILTYEKHFETTLGTQKSLSALEQLVNGLVTKLEQGAPVSNIYISNFHQLVSTFSTFLDGYASYIQAAQILEHCFVLSLKKIITVI